jgi:2,4-diketo-3-deoxy-L-fuconate hydrolase
MAPVATKDRASSISPAQYGTSRVISPISGLKSFPMGTWRRLAAIDPDPLPLVAGATRLGPVPSGVGKFIAIGLNYSDHASEWNMPVPAEPIVFMRATSCLSGPNDPIMLTKDSTKTDWEVELGVIVGRTARYVEETNALEYVAGYVLANDVSERSYQLERGGTWSVGQRQRLRHRRSRGSVVRHCG